MHELGLAAVHALLGQYLKGAAEGDKGPGIATLLSWWHAHHATHPECAALVAG
jgi:hypothetical protein